MAVRKEVMRSGGREAWGILLLALCVLVLLSLASYQPEDIPLVQSPPHRPALNFIGPAGAWLAYVLFMTLGVGGYLVAVDFGLMGLFMLFKHDGRTWPKAVWLAGMLVSLLVLFELQPAIWADLIARLNVGTAGGVLGSLIGQALLVRFLGVLGAGIVASAILLVCFILVVEVHPLIVARQVGVLAALLYRKADAMLAERRSEKSQIEHEQRDVARERQRLERLMREQQDVATRAERRQATRPPVRPAVLVTPGEKPRALDERPRRMEKEEEDVEPATKPEKKRFFAPKESKPEPKPEPPAKARIPAPDAQYTLPSMDMLDPLPPLKDREIKGDFQASSAVLKDTFAEFGVEVDVTNVERGPVVTRYEVLPAPGVRVERIVNLSNNIALAMKAVSVRIQAPIPGKGVVGIEVPNPKTTLVYLREILETEGWQSGKAALPLALGKDVSGREIVADLAEMPHMLIAGATGSGKTVCMNSILAGLLMARTPNQMRLMLIDPKIVEFSVYNHLPHLVVPVITDAKKVTIGLRWAITEMEKRYKMFARVGVRNIEAFNNRPIVKQTELFTDGTAPEPDPADRVPDRIPYIVIIVDELADLMLVAQADIETSIARLAQLSRAVGIHMILATQRPSVNVITGTIKANFPARISFQVAQKVDSRTILDANGADKLLGKGDMLFLPPGTSKLARAQGTMTSDAEIRRIVEFLKKQGQPQYETTIKEKIESSAPDLPEAEEDELMEAAMEVIRQTKRASTSSLQRRLRIGYTRAARLMDMLEERGIVGPACGSDPREILVDLDGEIPQNKPDLTE